MTEIGGKLKFLAHERLRIFKSIYVGIIIENTDFWRSDMAALIQIIILESGEARITKTVKSWSFFLHSYTQNLVNQFDKSDFVLTDPENILTGPTDLTIQTHLEKKLNQH